ncbi:MAG: RsmB/NOP family class I SAM-dependent RNA methyltransferase [Sphingomonas sp.]|uniref:RsmB/NOP family class I SAM-dependent RNA methyltransferase n=1 Tax=Sphingomonas sp. TaxID=28214 RepID=UPI001203F204|nr:RsmB/NOP family class I SAM-dependent RNA methyltransferase [Sphingomonas sp.]THD36631.1 MAG: RsmB/NOP family class I SAM-dependent RNA methyltransferase [Sphingomonas sp.]
MTPAARTQAAIEILDQVIDAARAGGAAGDTLIARYFATRRYAGSKDRRAVRELVYAAIRRAGEAPENGRAAMVGLARDDDAIAATFDGSPHGPAPIAADEPSSKAGTVPAWIGKRFKASEIGPAEAAALVERAPLDLRVNVSRGGDPATLFADLGAKAIAGLPNALRLPSGTAIEATDAFRSGQVEVQDAGSQMVTLAARVTPGMAVIDLCAGAGGKSLALAAMMNNEGAILATDTDRGRLSRLPPRAERAGASIIETRLLNPNTEAAALADWTARADVVLIDAPCSGTGTWRRNPEARWRLTPARIERLVDTQRRLLGVAVPLVKPGGALVYIVCSLLDEEGADQLTHFLSAHPDWTAEPPIPFGRPRGAGVRLTPAHDQTDGFFVARLVRPC